MTEQLPVWLRRLAAALGTTRREELSRHGVPPAGARPSAVLLLFGEGPAGPDVLLIQRAAQLRSHGGQPAFPGGVVDLLDGGPVDTALREAAEEVGLDRDGVHVIGLLPDLYLPPTGYLVTPVVGWWRRPSPVWVVDPAEVARVERVPLAELVDPANRCRVRHASGYLGPAFVVRDLVVWGFTGGVLDRVLQLGGWATPWDPTVIRELVDAAGHPPPLDDGLPRTGPRGSAPAGGGLGPGPGTVET